MEFLQQLFTPENLVALITLTALEIVLGIDNVVFLTIVVEKLEASRQSLGRFVGLGLAMLLRIALLFLVSWVHHLETSLFSLFGKEITAHSVVLILGGLFLIAKATWEIHEKLEEVSEHIDEEDLLHGARGAGSAGSAEEARKKKKKATFWAVIAQVLMLDLIFSIDSVITAVGMAKSLEVIITAVVLAVIVMMIFAETVGRFVARNPTIKMLALAFLILIGVALVAEGFHVELPKGYIYSAMGFSLFVEIINLKVIKGMLRKRSRRKRQPAEEG